MRLISRTTALLRLAELRDAFRSHIAANFEHRAKSCGTCATRGACCLDAHFVNVRISRLDAEAVNYAINRLPAPKRVVVLGRAEQAIETFHLEENGRTYACPLYDPDAGCLVHEEAKPFACIAHACYENREDIPPDHLLTEQEGLVDDLNVHSYGRSQPWLPIPVAIMRERQTSSR
jgi:hypothetical protein